MAKIGCLKIRAEESFLQTLEELANESGTSKATVIDRAVGLYKKALEEAEKGRVIRFVEEEGHNNE